MQESRQTRGHASQFVPIVIKLTGAMGQAVPAWLRVG